LRYRQAQAKRRDREAAMPNATLRIGGTRFDEFQYLN
jgi:hypothetical protein